MNSKFLKKRLIIKNLIEIFNYPIIIVTQTNLFNYDKEIELNNFFLKKKFQSKKISSNFFKKFLKEKFFFIKSLSSNNCQIFYSKKNIIKDNFFSFLYLNKYSIFVGFFLFFKFINLKNINFLNLYINFITSENFLLKFFSKIINLFIILNKGE